MATDLRVVPQIDLVPTLSLLLGLPIPFGNLGSILPELFAGVDFHSSGLDSESLILNNDQLERFKFAADCNSRQIYKYLSTYTSMTGQFTGNSWETLESLYRELRLTFVSNPSSSELIDAFHAFTKTTLEICRDMWTTFDILPMLGGSTILCLSCALLLAILFRPTLIALPGTSSWPAIGLLLTVLSGAGILGFSHSRAPLLFAFCIVACYFIWCGVKLGKAKNLNIYTHLGWEGVFSCALIALRFAALNSNSFLETEHQVFRYFVVSLTLSNLFAWAYRQTLSLSRVSLLLLVTYAFTQHVSAKEQMGVQELSTVAAFFPSILLFSRPGLNVSHATILVCCAQFLSILSLFADGVEWSGRHFIWFVVMKIFSEVFVSSLVFYSVLQKFDLAARSPSGLLFRRPFWCLNFMLVAIYWSALHAQVLGDMHSDVLSEWILRILVPNLIIYISLIGLSVNFVRVGFRLSLFLEGILPLLLVISGYGSLPVFVSGTLILYLWSYFPPKSTLFLVTFVFMASNEFFYATGHTPQFSSLQFELAFLGADHYSLLRGVPFMIFNTFSAQILSPLLLQLVAKSYDRESYWRAAIYFVFAWAGSAAVTMIFTGLQRRHLMVWRVFAPKYIFDSLSMLVCQILMTVLSIWNENQK